MDISFRESISMKNQIKARIIPKNTGEEAIFFPNGDILSYIHKLWREVKLDKDLNTFGLRVTVHTITYK